MEQPPKTKEQVASEKAEIEKAIKKNRENQIAMIEALESVGASKEQIEKLRKAAGLELKKEKKAETPAPENITEEKPAQIEVVSENKEAVLEPEKTLAPEKVAVKGKNGKEKKPKFEIDPKVIETRTNELISQGYSKGTAHEIAGIEELVRVNVERKQYTEGNPKEKDREKKLASLEKNVEGNSKRREELLAEVKNPIKPEPTGNKAEVPKTASSQTPEDTEKDKATTKKDEIPPAVAPEKLPPEMINLDKLLQEKLDQLDRGPLPSKIKTGIINGLEKWEKFGVEQRDKEGNITAEGVLWKRMTKMAVNLALIGAIASVAVEQLAHTGAEIFGQEIFSASALGGGSTSYIGKKLAIGLGIGGIMEVGGNKIPPKVKKLIPYIMLAGTIGLSLATAGTAGIAIGAASGAGFIVSKLVKGKFTSEKIAEREKEAVAKIKGKLGKSLMTNLEFNEENVKEIEEEYKKVIKKYENQRIWGKLLDGARKLGVGALVSTVTLEASGHVYDYTHPQAQTGQETQIKHETDTRQSETKPENEIKHEKTDTEIKNQEEAKTQQETAGTTSFPKHNADFANVVSKAFGHEGQDQTNTSEPIEIKHTPAEMENIIVHKGEGIEHAFIRQIEGNHELAKGLGYEGNLNDAKALHAFAGREAHIIAIKTGYVDNAGHEVRVAEADKMGYEIKMENGHPVVNEETAEGKILETHHEGDKFEENPDKGEYVKNPEVKTEPTEGIKEELLGGGTTPHEGTDIREEPLGTGVAHQGGTNVNEEPLGDGQTISRISEIKHVEVRDENQNVISGKSDMKHIDIKEGDNNQGQGESSDKPSESNFQKIIDYGKVLEHINNIHESSINHLFPDEKSMHAWEGIKNDHDDFSAEKLMTRTMENTNETYQPLVSLVQKIHEITGLNPRGETVFQSAESPDEFLKHGLIKAEEVGRLDELEQFIKNY